MDLTNTRSLSTAKENKDLKETFQRIDELISSSKVKRITLSPQVYKKIISYFPIEMQRRLQDGFEYKESMICPLK